MKMIMPIDIVDAVITSSSIAENEYPLWDAQQPYVTGDFVIQDHAIYEAITDSLGVSPAEAISEWVRVSATNKFKAFDGYLSDQTTSANDISYTLRFGEITDALAVFNIECATLNVTMVSDAEGPIYFRSEPMIESDSVFDLYSYFFAPLEYRSSVIIDDLPAFSDAEITVEIVGPENKVGQIVIGNVFTIGAVKYGSGVSFKDYSSIDRTPFGNAEIIERDYTDTVDFNFVMQTRRIEAVKRKLAERRAKPTVFYSSSETVSHGTLVYGFAGQFNITISGPVESDAAMDVEGLT